MRGMKKQYKTPRIEVILLPELMELIGVNSRPNDDEPRQDAKGNTSVLNSNDFEWKSYNAWEGWE